MKEEIARQVNIILYGAASNATSDQEDIDDLFPGMSSIQGRPVMHPFGFVSRATKGTVSVIARIGAHFGNRMVMGHRDSNRPTDIVEGESGMYNAFGKRITLKKTKILIGSGTATEPGVLGNVLLAALTEILSELKTLTDAIKTGPVAITTTPGNPAPTHPTLIAACTQLESAIATAKSTYISDAGTNIVSKETYIERGT